jgi:hypothetical protein
MPTNTYTPLSTVTLTTSGNSIIFSSIPATYRDLIVVINATANSNVATIGLRFNGDSGNNYTYVSMAGNGSTASSSTNTQSVALIGYTNSTNPWVNIAQIMDYSATDKHKTILSRDDNAAANVGAVANRWANTAAITSVEVNAAVNSFASGTTVSIYGVIA